IETPFGSVYSSNITPDAATGIGAWSRNDFWRALHEGRSKDGRLLYPAFPYRTQAALRAWRALYFRAGVFRPDASRSAEWNRGAYLVRGLGHCDACHASRNMFGAVSHRLDLGGGVIPMQNWYAPTHQIGAAVPF